MTRTNLLNKHWRFCLIIIAFLLSSEASARTLEFLENTHPLFTFFGGSALINTDAHTQTYVGTDDNQFIYHNKNNTESAGLVGAFLGIELPLIQQKLFIQTGIEYEYISNTTISGSNTVGIEPETATAYNYQWQLETQQLLAVAKLFTSFQPLKFNPIYPYISVGLGSAFNKSSHFKSVTEETGSINIAPSFRNHTQTSFTYSLGLGVDIPLNNNIRIGLGYRFSDLGPASLNDGVVVFNQYRAPIPFTLETTNNYTNQFIGQISYVA